MSSISEVRQKLTVEIDSIALEVFNSASGSLDFFIYLAFGGAVIKILQNFYYSSNDWWGYIAWIPLWLILLFHTNIMIAILTLFSDLVFVTDLKDISNEVASFWKLPPMEDSGGSLLTASISTIIIMIMHGFVSGLIWIITMIAETVATGVFIYIKLKTLSKIMMLAFFSPLNISLSFYSAFQGMWTGWLLRVVEVALYIPALYFVQWASLKLLVRVFKPSILLNVVDMGDYYQNAWLGMFFYAIMIFSMFGVMKLVAWALSSGVSAVGNSKTAQAVRMIAMKALTSI